MAIEQTERQENETSAGATEKAEELASQAKEQLHEKVEEAKGRTSGRLRQELDSQSSELAERIGPFPEALRRAADYLESQGSGPAAKATGEAAARAERLASYLEEAGSDRILGDLEVFARRRPWVVGGIATAAGFVASRFLVASSERRYESPYEAAQRFEHDGAAPVGSRIDEMSGLPLALSGSGQGGG